MGRPVKTYEDWLQLSDDERREVHRQDWDVYGREGLAIAYMAATRLALRSPRKVLDISIGTYHFGEYLLQLTVSRADYRDCPPMLEERFEGFRVVWIPAIEFPTAPAVLRALEGRWRAEQGDYEFEVRFTAGGPAVCGRVRSTGEELQIDGLMANDERIFFNTYEAGRRLSARHVFETSTPDRFADETKTIEYYTRVTSD
jgi:hypothetical protein